MILKKLLHCHYRHCRPHKPAGKLLLLTRPRPDLLRPEFLRFFVILTGLTQEKEGASSSTART
jgi:hypothetical protein